MEGAYGKYKIHPKTASVWAGPISFGAASPISRLGLIHGIFGGGFSGFEPGQYLHICKVHEMLSLNYVVFHRIPYQLTC
jgi:hypothetical protein